MSSLLRELIVRAVEQSKLYEDSSREERVVTMIFDEIQMLDSLPFRLPMPNDPRLDRISEAASQLEFGALSVKELARLAGTSPRNLNRIFRKETGLTSGQWKRHARNRAALSLLASDVPVTEVALDIGYENPSNFIIGFKRYFGETPGKYFKKRKYGDNQVSRVSDA